MNVTDLPRKEQETFRRKIDLQSPNNEQVKHPIRIKMALQLIHVFHFIQIGSIKVLYTKTVLYSVSIWYTTNEKFTLLICHELNTKRGKHLLSHH